jgi:hypothetical protein
MIEGDNLLTMLNKGAKQDESFVTDAFVHLLWHLLKNEPEAATKLLRLLTSGLLAISSECTAQVRIITQVSTSTGRPDIEIRSPDWLIYVEVKVNSPIDQSQLTRYLDALGRSGTKNTGLVLLTRYPETVNGLEKQPGFCQTRWCEVADWLQAEKARMHDPISVYLTNQFVSFLGDRNIAMRQVTSELAPGLTSLRSLLLMVGEALHRCELKFKQNAAWDYIGYYCHRNKYWVGIYFDEPDSLCFETYEFDLAADAFEPAAIGGKLEDHWQGGGRKKWTDQLDMAPSPGDFFVLSSAEQIQRVSQFVKSCIDRAARIEASGRLKAR